MGTGEDSKEKFRPHVKKGASSVKNLARKVWNKGTDAAKTSTKAGRLGRNDNEGAIYKMPGACLVGAGTINADLQREIKVVAEWGKKNHEKGVPKGEGKSFEPGAGPWEI